MDAVLFEMKKAHLAGARFGRELLKPFGGKLTPARFNLLLALYGKVGMRQSDLWKLLGVVPSVVSEMLDAMEELEWVKAIRAADGRTRFIMMTALGKKLFNAAYELCIRSGTATIEVSRALSGPDREKHPEDQRYKAVPIAMLLVEYFGWVLPAADDLYLWNPDDYRDQVEWPIGERAHWELRVADEGMIDAPMFQAGDVLVEIDA